MVRVSVPAAVVGVRFEIEVFDVLGVVQRVGVCAGERVNACKRPSRFAHVGRYDGDGYEEVLTEPENLCDAMHTHERCPRGLSISV